LQGDAPFEHAEPEVASAVADFGGAPPAEHAPALEHEAPNYQRSREPEPAPVPQPAPRDVAPERPASPEPPRRRSTIREPAPMFSSGAMSDVQPAPAPEPPPSLPEPAATSPEPAAANGGTEAKTRRFGWWNRRG
jgi:ribonuclease E